MAHLFRPAHDAETQTWLASPLDANAFALDIRDGNFQLEPLDTESLESTAPALLVRTATECGSEQWVALAGSDAAINGRPLRARIAVLSDRDELRVGGVSTFVSFERRAVLEQYDGDDRPTCPRCKTDIENGHSTVVCPQPGCAVRHHEDEALGLPCWTDMPLCALCPQPTALDAELSFAPEDL